MRCLYFDLLVEPIAADRQSGWLPRHRARVWSSPAGQSRAWEFTWDYVDREVSRYLELGRASQGRTDPRNAKLETFGSLMFERVFGDTGKQLLERSRDHARRENLPLRLRVRLDGLADLPWECLHDGERFLCLSADTPLVRCLAVNKPVNPEPLNGPLRILAVIAGPPDPGVDSIDAEKGWADIVSALRDTDGVQLDRLARPTYGELRRKLQGDGPFHVLHVVGHGRFNMLPGEAGASGSGEGELLLEDSGGRPAWVRARKLAELLTEHRPLRLVVLNACESAATDSVDPFTGVAQRLLRLGTPAVVAMQAAISQPAATVFSRRLYQQLAAGVALDSAVTAGRQAMHDDDRSLEWFTPVVFANPTDVDVCVFTRSEPTPVSVPASRGGRTGSSPITESQRAARDQVRAVAAEGRGARFNVCADSGCGKTWLLGTLAKDLAELGHTTLFISAPRPGDSGADTDPGVRDVAICEAIIARLADDITPSDTVVDEVATDIANQVRAAATAGLTHDTGNPANRALTRRRRAARLQAMGTELVGALQLLSTQTCIAILLDDLQLLGPGPWHWLQGVFVELPRAVIVCAHQPTTLGADWRRLELAAMTTEEAHHYVLANLPGWSPEQARAVTALITAPHTYPVWIVTWCQMIRQALEPGVTTEQINRYIRAAPGRQDDDYAHTELLADRIDRFKVFVDDYAHRIVGIRMRLFDQLTVLTRVTAQKTRSGQTMLAFLFPRVEDIEADTLFQWLANSQFMTRFGDDPTAGMRMHDLLRGSAEDLLSGAAEPQRRATYRQLQRNAERYYRELLHFEDDLDEDSRWSAWSRYEDPVFRRNCRDWLHHAARVNAVDFQDTERAFVRLWLEVFWWWDADVPTDFCRQLLTDYRVLCDVRRRWNLVADERKLRCLEAFYRGYVSDWRERHPGRHSERWQSAGQALQTLWGLFGFGTDAVPHDWVQARTYTLVAVLRGDTVRYGGDLDAERLAAADDWYRVAAVASVKNADSWIGHWISFYHADMWVDIDPAKAGKLVEDLTELIDDEHAPDHELRVHLTRLHGDLAWQTKDYARALDIYARACLHGYVFQIRQEVMQTPNEYSLNVYEKMLDTALHRLEEARRLVRDGLVEPSLADDAPARWHRLFAPFWEAGPSDVPETESGFPPPPKPNELNKLGTPYSAAVKWTLMNMTDQLEDRPLDKHLDLR